MMNSAVDSAHVDFPRKPESSSAYAMESETDQQVNMMILVFKMMNLVLKMMNCRAAPRRWRTTRHSRRP